MKFLSLFTKAPTHQRFNYTPRYYDPVKEELEERESRIKTELARNRGEVIDENSYRSRIAGSFQAARKRGSSKPTGGNSTMLRLVIILFMVVFIIAFLEWGRPVLYSLFALVPLYFYTRFKNRL
jgi:hypothetical protein